MFGLFGGKLFVERYLTLGIPAVIMQPETLYLRYVSIHHRFEYFFLLSLVFFIPTEALHAQKITTANKPAQLDIRIAGSNSIRITLKPLTFKPDFPYTPAIAE